MFSRDSIKPLNRCLLPGAIYNGSMNNTFVGVTSNMVYSPDRESFFVLKQRHSCECSCTDEDVKDIQLLDISMLALSPATSPSVDTNDHRKAGYLSVVKLKEFENPVTGNVLGGDKEYVVVGVDSFIKDQVKLVELNSCKPEVITVRLGLFDHYVDYVRQQTPVYYFGLAVNQYITIKQDLGDKVAFKEAKIIDIDYTNPYYAILVDNKGVEEWVALEEPFSKNSNWFKQD